MTIRPRIGMVLVEVQPRETESYGGIALPEVTEGLDSRGEKKPPSKALVLQVGPWRKTRKGLSILPDFKPGDEVLISYYSGKRLNYGVNQSLRILGVEEVLAVIEPIPTTAR